ncbi:MAG: hypothetical protein M0Z91_10830 [Actinomycetota bacterium]|jgi:hypothetical protein|nr:hypothetical protein [Actinomycetota bacterium]
MAIKTRAQTLEGYFHQDMIALCFALRQEGYWPVHFHRSVEEIGGLRAAKRLLHSVNYSEGFLRLEGMGLLAWSIESHALFPWYQELFTEEELDVARSRLMAFGFSGHLAARHSPEPPAWYEELSASWLEEGGPNGAR